MAPRAAEGIDVFLTNRPELRTKECGYFTFDNIAWSDVWDNLKPWMPHKCDNTGDFVSPQSLALFDGHYVTRWTSEHWEIPLVASAVYIAMLVGLKSYMASRPKYRFQTAVVCWNYFLSFFSLAGVIYCVPRFLFGPAGLLTQGWYASVCANAATYGDGEVGFFVALFIYSKLAELLDTFFLLVRKSPVILLHWYHHLSVLLYCWHAYSSRIGTGLWFASMNYSVHAIMYCYFGLTQSGDAAKKFARKFAMLITTLQLTQMVFGIAATVSSVVYHANGAICHVSLINSGFGLAMYTSYFVLFLQLFLTNYVFKAKSHRRVDSAADMTMKGKTKDVVEAAKTKSYKD